MNLHVNGWDIIAKYLKRSSIRQGDLAQVLHISKAAVSQIKNGQFLLNPRQLAVIADYLKFDDAAITEFYTMLFNARLTVGEEVEEPALPASVGRRRFRVNLEGEERRVDLHREGGRNFTPLRLRAAACSGDMNRRSSHCRIFCGEIRRSGVRNVFPAPIYA